MENILVFSDLHILEKDLEECSLIKEELLDITKEYNITTIINGGDSFDKIRPTNRELNFFAEFIKQIPCLMKTVIASSHESISDVNTILTHYSILENKKIELYPNEWTDGNLLVGHYICNEALKGFGSSVTKKGLIERSKLALLGHQHMFQAIEDGRVYQLGSSRYVRFDESNDKNKQVCIITDYGTKTQKTAFLALKSVYPMQTLIFNRSTPYEPMDANLGHSTGGFWHQTPKNTKTRFLFKDLDSYKEFIPFEKEVREYYAIFKVELDFTQKEYIPEQKKENISLQTSLREFIKKNKVEEKIANIIINTFSDEKS